MELGRYEMERKTFEEYEREIRSELNRVLGVMVSTRRAISPRSP
jgi:hypothetical protein